MTYTFLPQTGSKKMYSPAGVLQMFRDAVAQAGGNTAAVFNDQKNKTLIELFYASVLSSAIYKWTGERFFMFPADSPDIHFICVDDQKKQEDGFSVELMTIYDHGSQIFDGDYVALAENVWNVKGGKDYGAAELLLVSRLNGPIDIDAVATELSKYKWKFPRIWMTVLNGKTESWTVFEVVPYQGQNTIGSITVKISDFPF